MAQQYYNLEEAASKLGISADELREMAKKKQIRAFQDKGNWRFRASEIDERARQMGGGSEPDLTLADSAKKSDSGKKAPDPAKKAPAKTKQPSDADVLPVDFQLEDEVQLGHETPTGGPSSSTRGAKTPAPKSASDSDVRLVPDSGELNIDSDVKLDDPAASKSRGADSGVRIDKAGSDSDVKLVEESKSPSDSDIRLDDSAKKSKKKPVEANIITEEIDLDAEEAKAEAKAKTGKGAKPIKPRPTTQYNPNMPVLPTSSPYELSENDIGLDDPAAKPGKKAKPGISDSSSDHEMIAFDSVKARQDLGSGEIPLLAGDEDVDLGELPAPNAGNSGINLKDAADSGISLEDGGSDELEFELSLDAGSTPKPQKKAAPAAPVQKRAEEDSSSEFELSMDGEEGSDPDSGSSSSSEFELSIDDGDSGSELKLENSDSEFELTLDDEGGLAGMEESGKDIFEETNFDVPALDESGSEAVALDTDGDTDLESDSGSSDFEISLEDSGTTAGSQVVSLDEDEADEAAATIAKPRKTASPSSAKAKAKAAPADEEEPEMDFGDLEGDEEEPPAKAKPAKKKPAKAAVADDEDEEDEEDLRAPAAAEAPVEWGPLPAVLLFPTFLVLFIVGLMSFELIQGMWGYHRSTKVGRPIIDNIARLFDDKIPKD
jgi:excisionase family DNA binding protein